MGLNSFQAIAQTRADQLRQIQDRESRQMKVTIANAMPTINRGRTSEPNPLQGLIDKIMEDGKPRHIICDDADEVTKVKNLLRKGFLAHNAALKTAKDAEKEFAFYVHFGPRVKRGPRKPKETVAATETVAAEN